jgi:hypothetical protein
MNPESKPVVLRHCGRPGCFHSQPFGDPWTHDCRTAGQRAADEHYRKTLAAQEAARSAPMECPECHSFNRPGSAHLCRPPVSPADRDVARFAVNALARFRQPV